VIWLIENDDVIEVAEAVAAGVSGAYYWDQVGPDLLSAIDRVAPAQAIRQRAQPAAPVRLKRAAVLEDVFFPTSDFPEAPALQRV
jgi:hypothetical protein